MRVVVLLCALVSQCLAATIVEVLADDPNMSTLVSLVAQAGLVNALNTGEFTVFAPNNAAFSALPSATLTALGNDPNALTNVLTYHVVQGKVPSSAASNELQITALNGQKVRFNIYDHNNAITVQGSQVIALDKVASNGIIHVMNKVLMPPEGDIVDIVAKTSDVSTLLSLVQLAGIASALKGDALTVFAPTNDAFARLSSSTLSTLTNDTNLLTEILQYHVVPQTEFSPGLYNGESLTTLDKNSERVIIYYDTAGVRVNDNARVTTADIGTTNGVIHLIDHVLIPDRYPALTVGRK